MKQDDSTARDGRRRKAVLLAAALMLAAAVAGAQIPDRFQNLKVLPEEVEKNELVDLMKSFCRALDVRCTFCHVGEEEAPLSEVDFVSDDNPHKDVARVMMRMVDAINGTHLPKIGHEPEHRVSCFTCHRGQTEPSTLEQVLAEAVREDGTDAALAKYRDLRERYYGSGSFDFSAGTLTRLASQLVDAGQAQAAIAFLELNTELHPDEMRSYFFLGSLQADSGNKAEAIESLKKALELEPDNAIVKRKLRQLQGG